MEEKITVVRSLLQHKMSLSRALKLCGVTKKRWYYKPKQRELAINPDILQMIQEIRDGRSFYGKRSVAAEMSRRLDRVVNRKTVRRIYKKRGCNKPGRTQSTKTRWTPIKAERPNEVWETDITYVWCGPVDGWCYCFNILDIFTRQWIAYRFSTLVTADVAIESLVEVVAVAKPDCSKLTLQCDNGSQYTGKKFRKDVSLLGIRLKFIRTHTPEQNGHIESFHGTLKREYIRPHDFASYQDAEAVISEASRDYNHARLHSL